MSRRSSALSLVKRRCLVCEDEQDVVEPRVTDEIGPPCPRCGAPTERRQTIDATITPKNPYAVALGRLGGVKGGPARAKALKPERRRAIARNAAKARWERRSRH